MEFGETMAPMAMKGGGSLFTRRRPLEKREGPRAGRNSRAERCVEIKPRHVELPRLVQHVEDLLGQRRGRHDVHVRTPAEDPAVQRPVAAHLQAEPYAAIGQLLELLRLVPHALAHIRRDAGRELEHHTFARSAAKAQRRLEVGP